MAEGGGAREREACRLRCAARALSLVCSQAVETMGLLPLTKDNCDLEIMRAKWREAERIGRQMLTACLREEHLMQAEEGSGGGTGEGGGGAAAAGGGGGAAAGEGAGAAAGGAAADVAAEVVRRYQEYMEGLLPAVLTKVSNFAWDMPLPSVEFAKLGDSLLPTNPPPLSLVSFAHKSQNAPQVDSRGARRLRVTVDMLAGNWVPHALDPARLVDPSQLLVSYRWRQVTQHPKP